MSYYWDRYQLKAEEFPQAERIWRGCVALPLYPTLSDDEIDYICNSLYELLGYPSCRLEGEPPALLMTTSNR